MADNKFGLSDALINAVRQVAENSAPLPRDERERDLERQARLKPKSLDEAALSPKQKLIAKKRPPFNKIDGDDLAALRGENMKEGKKLVDATTDTMLKADPAAGLIAKAVVGGLRLAGKGLKKIVGKEEFQVRNSDDIVDEGMFSVKTNKPKEGDIAPETLADKLNAQNAKLKPKSKTPHPGPVGSDVKEEAEIDEATKKLTARERFIKGLKRGGYDVDASYAAAVKADKEMKQKNSETMSTYAKEEADLDEAKVVRTKRTPEQQAKADRMVKSRLQKSKAARAAQAASGQVRPAKAKAYVSPETDEKGEKDSEKKETHIVMAARKAVSLGEYPFTFEDGKTHILDKNTARRIIATHSQQKDKGEFEERLRGSHKDMMGALKNPDNAPPKRDTKAARLAPKPLGKNFMADLARVARGGPARER